MSTWLYNACFVSLNRRRKLTADSISAARRRHRHAPSQPSSYFSTGLRWVPGIMASCGLVTAVACLSVFYRARRATVICRVYNRSTGDLGPQNSVHPVLRQRGVR